MLAALGMLGVAGHALGSPALKGLSVATAASPAPKVFTTHQGLETFSTKFELRWTEDGSPHRLPITSEVYPRLRGPYNRRNVYGAILAYGPVLHANEQTRPMFDEVARHALCPERGAVVLRELGLDPDRVRDVAVVYTPRAGTPETVARRLDAPCAGRS